MSILNPILVFSEDDQYIPMYAGSFFVKPSDVKPIIEGLINYVNTYTDEDILATNKQREYEMFHACHSYKKDPTQVNPRKAGYVYVLLCADKYKIGYSKDVEHRMRQLDTRPFKLKLLFKAYSNQAYTIEKELHKRLEIFKEAGEWYSGIDESTIKDIIEEIARYLECDVQY